MTGRSRVAAAVRDPRHGLTAVRRELAVARDARSLERALGQAARDGGPVIVGPFVGEVGYELLYWIPFARALLRRHGIAPEQCVALTRGGAGAWYADFATRSVELFDLVPHERLVAAMEERHRRVHDRKQLVRDPLERELVSLAHQQIGPAAVLHPSAMFGRLRSLWFRDGSVEDAVRQLDVRMIAAPPSPIAGRYVAVKLYTSDHSFPATARNRAVAGEIVQRVAGADSVVLLGTGIRFDDHDELDADGVEVQRIDHLLGASDNLAVQTAIVAGAVSLVCTYGGFSYLGPLVGVPTIALHGASDFLPAHLAVAHATLPGGPSLFQFVPLADEGAVDDAVAALGLRSGNAIA